MNQCDKIYIVINDFVGCYFRYRLQKRQSNTETLAKCLYPQIWQWCFLIFTQNVYFFRIFRVAMVILLTLLYYLYVVVSLLFYSSWRKDIQLFDRSGDLYINIFGHLGWLYARDDVPLKYYAMFEALLTCLMPMLLAFSYVMQKIPGRITFQEVREMSKVIRLISSLVNQ